MTVEELEGKLTSIYHEFAETISENETDEQIVARSKEWFVKRLSEEIIAIDKKLGIVVTKENNEVNYYWVKDPNSKPSLYRTGRYDSLVL